MTQKKLKIKKGDEVIVIAGKDKGKKGSVLSVLRGEENKDRVVVSGVNLIKRHQKPGREGNGGIVSKEASLHISNVALLDPKENKATRVGFKLLSDGKKTRIAKRSGEVIGKN